MNRINYIETELISYYLDVTEEEFNEQTKSEEDLVKLIKTTSLGVVAASTIILVTPVLAHAAMGTVNSERTWVGFWKELSGLDVILDSQRSLLKRATQVVTSVSGTTVWSMATVQAFTKDFAAGSLLEKSLLYTRATYLVSLVADRWIK